MYRPYFGLNDLPFKTTPDLQMFYKHGTRQEILDALLYTIERGDGIIKVTGEVGSGKTMLLRLLASKLDDTYELVYINSPNLSSKDLLLYICSELHIQIDSSAPKFDIVNALKQRLLELHAQNKKVVMLVDEAQSMSLETLEEIRLLSNIETADDKLLQIVLFGQPELDKAIEHPNIRQLKSRITYSIYVRPFNYQEVKAYLNYRLRKVGYQGLDLFDNRVAKKICRLSDGLPRSINVLADKALMAAFSTDAKTIHPKHIQPTDDFNTAENSRVNSLLIAALLFMLLIGAGYYTYHNVITNQGMDNVSSSTNPDLQTLPSAIEKSDNKSVINIDTLQEANLAAKPVVKEGEVKTDSSSVDTVSNGAPLSANNVKENVAIDETKTLKTPAYQITSLSNEYITKLIAEHKKTAAWLNATESNYMIQLSTRRVDSLNNALRFYKRVLTSDEPVKALIDFHEPSQSFRIKFFYLDALSVSGISNNIEQLPQSVARSKPFITPISALKRKLSYTEQKLIEVGVPL
ncbi:ExeA family protein [Thiomicrorhabdus sediminis]|uniref:AAA family ATPase n=1 Tax=Thiomicrorhabdus sediminis TaxID=2580412 RepID=A0A4P9K6I4_9GAMM|nr:AAA family ATPase [Thiomicrorhabdus sediminis]QCU90694.1 AAA family ATPase [Thiomicrorhabdus sediminis]